MSGRLLKRYKRFLADVLLDSGEQVIAHCANPGSMKSLLEPVPRVWLSRARPGRKLAYTWEVAEYEDALVYVNPVGANRVVLQAIETGAIEELCGYDIVQPEVKYGEKSRIDFLLTGSPGRAYVEVKSATLTLGEGRAAFPDSVTTRGTKHLEELSEICRAGDRAVLLFAVNRTDARSVEAATLIDPVYSRALFEAHQAGVEVIAYSGEITRAGYSLSRKVPVILPRS